MTAKTDKTAYTHALPRQVHRLWIGFGLAASVAAALLLLSACSKPAEPTASPDLATATPVGTPGEVIPSPEATEEATPAATEEPGMDVTPTPTVEPGMDVTPTPTVEPGMDVTPTPTEEPGIEFTPTPFPLATEVPTPAAVETPLSTISTPTVVAVQVTATPESTPTATPAPTVAPTPTALPLATPTPAATPTPLATATPVGAATPIASPTAEPTVTPGATPTVTSPQPTPTVTGVRTGPQGTQYKLNLANDHAHALATCANDAGSGESECWYDAGANPSVSVLPMHHTDMGNGTRWAFVGWSEPLPARMDGPFTATAQWQPQYLFTLSDPQNRATFSGCAETPWCNPGDQVTVSASSFDMISGQSRQKFAGCAPSCTVTVSGPQTVAVSWQPQYRVTLNVNRAGATAACSVADCWYDAGAKVDASLSSTTIPEGSDIRYVFAEWSVNLPVTVSAPITVNAVWKTQYLLKVTKDGTVPGNTGCLPNPDCWYDSGAIAFATLSTGVDVDSAGTTRKVFERWAADATGSAFGESNGIGMAGPRTAQATGHMDYKLTLNANRGEVVAACSVADCWYAGGSQAGATVSPSQVMEGSIRYDFRGWSPTLPATMNGPLTATAQWAPPSYDLKLDCSGEFQVSPQGCGTNVSYPQGTTVTLTASAPVAWTGCDSSTSTTCQVSISGQKNVTANKQS